MWATMRAKMGKMSGMDDPHKSTSFKFFILWLTWVLTGACFYAYAPDSNLGLAKGLYMAINIGYSIGFGYPLEENINYLWFSTCYVLVGSSFVAVALGFFADKITADNASWFTNLLATQEHEKELEANKSFVQYCKHYWFTYSAQIRAVMAWLVWVAIMIAYSCAGLGWTYVEGQYFAISTLSTGGHWALPREAPTWMFVVTSIFAALGVPLMACAMAQAATLFMDHGDMEGTKALITEDVTGEELLMMRKLGLEDGDGEIDESEFIILCMIRLGQDPSLINFISQRFKELDADGGGTLSIEEITGGKYYLSDAGEIVSTLSRNALSFGGLKQFSNRQLQVDLSDSEGSEKGGDEKDVPVDRKDSDKPTEPSEHSKSSTVSLGADEECKSSVTVPLGNDEECKSSTVAAPSDANEEEKKKSERSLGGNTSLTQEDDGSSMQGIEQGPTQANVQEGEKANGQANDPSTRSYSKFEEFDV